MLDAKAGRCIVSFSVRRRDGGFVSISQRIFLSYNRQNAENKAMMGVVDFSVFSMDANISENQRYKWILRGRMWTRCIFSVPTKELATRSIRPYFCVRAIAKMARTRSAQYGSVAKIA